MAETKKKEVKQKITKDMLIGEAVQKYPETALVMMEFGLHCVGCHISAQETVEQGAKGHGLNDEEVDDMVKEMNEVLKKKKR
jgi:hybrid cluster-associated redox disulfide protein